MFLIEFETFLCFISFVSSPCMLCLCVAFLNSGLASHIAMLHALSYLSDTVCFLILFSSNSSGI